MNIDFEWYKTFYHVALNKSFTKGAASLNMTQSAVSQTIGNLESQLNLPLFFREARKIRLTPEGQILFDHISQAYGMIKAGEKKLESMKSLESGEITIGVGDTICRYFLIPKIRIFTEMYPGVQVHIVNRTSQGIVELLKKGQLDIGILTLPWKDPQIEVSPFLQVEDVFVANEKFSALKGREIGLTELAEQPLLLLNKASSTRKNLDQLFEEEEITLKSPLAFESIELMIEFAKIGTGIAHVLKKSIEEDINRGVLFELKTKSKLPLRTLGIGSLAKLPLTRSAKEFVSLLKSENGSSDYA